jgi:hypothetical protein
MCRYVTVATRQLCPFGQGASSHSAWIKYDISHPNWSDIGNRNPIVRTARPTVSRLSSGPMGKFQVPDSQGYTAADFVDRHQHDRTKPTRQLGQTQKLMRLCGTQTPRCARYKQDEHAIRPVSGADKQVWVCILLEVRYSWKRPPEARPGRKGKSNCAALFTSKW